METPQEKIEQLKKLDILYIEDELNVQAQMSKTLQLFFHNVYSFDNAEDAFEFYKNTSVDIILTDVTLGGITGLDFIEKIRAQNKEIPIIVLSAHTDTNFLLKASKLKLVEYLVKPIDFNQLQKVLFDSLDELNTKKHTSYQFKNGIEYNMEKKLLSINNQEVKLTHYEIKLLTILIEKQNNTVPTDEIKSCVWDDPYDATDLALKSLLHKLRKKIGKDSIKNISGVGYYLN